MTTKFAFVGSAFSTKKCPFFKFCPPWQKKLWRPDTIIKPYISEKHMLRSSYEFLEKLQEINLNSNQVMVSSDVKSLFTNVPLQEAIDLISDKIFDKNSNANQLPIKKKIFKKLLNLATKGIFLYKDKLFQQIDGVSIGSPLGPTIANFFLAETKTRFLQQQLNAAPKVYFLIDVLYR